MKSFCLPYPQEVFLTLINKVLTEVKIKEVVISRDPEKIPCVDNYRVESYIVTNNEKEIELPSDAIFFRSVEDFKHNNPLHHNETIKYMFRNHITDFSGVHNKWYCEDGEIKKFDFFSIIKFKVNYYHKITALNGTIPNDYYHRKDEACFYNDIKVVKDDGSVEIINAPYDKVKLTAEQEQIATELKGVLEKMKTANMSVIAVENGLYVVNRQNADYEFAESAESSNVELKVDKMFSLNTSLYETYWNGVFVTLK